MTIGICAKNAENTIEEAINSAIQQDFNHELMEMILVDDGSKDRTLQIMKKSITGNDFHAVIFTGPWKGIA